MTPLQLLKERFERDSVSIRWGGIASDLLRLSAMVHAKTFDPKIFQDILTETKLFTEWLAPQVGFEHQEAILSLQRDLSGVSPEYSSNKDIEANIRAWSGKVLEISGLAC